MNAPTPRSMGFITPYLTALSPSYDVCRQLDHFSVSQIKNYLRCERYWWGAKVADMQEPGSKATDDGKKYHAETEAYQYGRMKKEECSPPVRSLLHLIPPPLPPQQHPLLKTPKTGVWYNPNTGFYYGFAGGDPKFITSNPDAGTFTQLLDLSGWVPFDPTLHLGPFGLPGRHLEWHINHQLKNVFSLALEGFIDFWEPGDKYKPHRIRDYKFMKNFDWCVPEDQMHLDLQLLMYARYVWEIWPDHCDQMYVGHIQVSKSECVAQEVEVLVNKKHTFEMTDRYRPIVDRMKRAAQINDIRQTTTNAPRGIGKSPSCKAFGKPCIMRNLCENAGENPEMSNLLASLQKAPTSEKAHVAPDAKLNVDPFPTDASDAKPKVWKNPNTGASWCFKSNGPTNFTTAKAGEKPGWEDSTDPTKSWVKYDPTLHADPLGNTPKSNEVELPSFDVPDMSSFDVPDEEEGLIEFLSTMADEARVQETAKANGITDLPVTRILETSGHSGVNSQPFDQDPEYIARKALEDEEAARRNALASETEKKLNLPANPVESGSCNASTPLEQVPGVPPTVLKKLLEAGLKVAGDISRKTETEMTDIMGTGPKNGMKGLLKALETEKLGLPGQGIVEESGFELPDMSSEEAELPDMSAPAEEKVVTCELTMVAPGHTVDLGNATGVVGPRSSNGVMVNSAGISTCYNPARQVRPVKTFAWEVGEPCVSVNGITGLVKAIEGNKVVVDSKGTILTVDWFNIGHPVAEVPMTTVGKAVVESDTFIQTVQKVREAQESGKPSVQAEATPVLKGYRLVVGDVYVPPGKPQPTNILTWQEYFERLSALCRKKNMMDFHLLDYYGEKQFVQFLMENPPTEGTTLVIPKSMLTNRYVSYGIARLMFNAEFSVT